MTVDDILFEAWRRGNPTYSYPNKRFPRGFWQDVARAAVEIALAGDLSAPLSFRQTMCGNWGMDTPRPQMVKGVDVSKLEFKL